MGMYTELVLGVDLVRDTPEDVIDILKYMIEGEFEDPKPIILDHPLFKTDRWRVMLRCDSCCFGGCTNSTIQESRYKGDVYRSSIRSNLKNYDSEIELFLNWLSPYIETRGFIGYMRYEEYDDPTLIYCVNGKIEYVKNDGNYEYLIRKQEREDKVTPCAFLISSMMQLLDDCRYLYKQDGWRTGGYLHILLDDDNFDDESILFCKEQCMEHPEDPYSELGIKICDEYLKMSMESRCVFDWVWTGWDGMCESQGRCAECKYVKED